MTDKYGVGQDPYCYPNTSVLINLLDLKSEHDIEAAEVEFTSYRLQTFQPDFDNLTFDALCQILCFRFTGTRHHRADHRTH